MKISCFKRYGPLNSKPIFGSLIKSMQDAGDTVLIDKDDNCDVAVIWSVLWQGRMAHYDTAGQFFLGLEPEVKLY